MLSIIRNDGKKVEVIASYDNVNNWTGNQLIETLAKEEAAKSNARVVVKNEDDPSDPKCILHVATIEHDSLPKVRFYGRWHEGERVLFDQLRPDQDLIWRNRMVTVKNIHNEDPDSTLHYVQFSNVPNNYMYRLYRVHVDGVEILSELA